MPDWSSAQWRKSSRSGDTGGNCVEVAELASVVGWHKSSRSTNTGGNCVEVADLVAGVAVRDSKDPDGGRLMLDAAAWRTLTSHIKDGALDLT